MDWTTALSALACLALVVKLTFFTCQHRQASRGVYRLLLFLVTVYAGSQVIGIMYRPDEPVNPWESLFHVFLFIGSLLAKPEYFPGNCK